MSANETIRNRIKRRVRLCVGVGLLSWLSFFLVPIIGDGKPQPPLMLLGLALLAGALIALQFAIKCPRCSQRLGQEIGMRVGVSIWKKPPNFCPYCGVSLDQPCSRTQSQDTLLSANPSQNPIK